MEKKLKHQYHKRKETESGQNWKLKNDTWIFDGKR